jgi:hypothetical protein
VQELRLIRIGSSIINFFTLAAACYQAAAFKLLKMVRNGRTCHADESRDIYNTFLAVAEHPKNAYTAFIAQLFEDIGDYLKIIFTRHFVKFSFYFLSMVMGESAFCHIIYFLIITYYLGGKADFSVFKGFQDYAFYASTKSMSFFS